jgi:hypothetical protein
MRIKFLILIFYFLIFHSFSKNEDTIMNNFKKNILSIEAIGLPPQHYINDRLSSIEYNYFKLGYGRKIYQKHNFLFTLNTSFQTFSVLKNSYFSYFYNKDSITVVSKNYKYYIDEKRFRMDISVNGNYLIKVNKNTFLFTGITTSFLFPIKDRINSITYIDSSVYDKNTNQIISYTSNYPYGEIQKKWINPQYPKLSSIDKFFFRNYFMPSINIGIFNTLNKVVVQYSVNIYYNYYYVNSIICRFQINVWI